MTVGVIAGVRIEGVRVVAGEVTASGTADTLGGAVTAEAIGVMVVGPKATSIDAVPRLGVLTTDNPLQAGTTAIVVRTDTTRDRDTTDAIVDGTTKTGATGGLADHLPQRPDDDLPRPRRGGLPLLAVPRRQLHDETPARPRPRASGRARRPARRLFVAGDAVPPTRDHLHLPRRAAAVGRLPRPRRRMLRHRHTGELGRPRAAELHRCVVVSPRRHRYDAGAPRRRLRGAMWRTLGLGRRRRGRWSGRSLRGRRVGGRIRRPVHTAGPASR